MGIVHRLVPVAWALAVLGLLVPVSASKRTVETPQVITAPMDILYAAPGDLNFSYGPTGEALRALTAGDRPASATITVTYNGFSPQAQAVRPRRSHLLPALCSNCSCLPGEPAR